jgi:hypothetical protein
MCIGWLAVFALGGAMLSRRVCRDPWITLSVFLLLFYGPIAWATSAQSHGFVGPYRWSPWVLVAYLNFDRNPSFRTAVIWGSVAALSLGGYQSGYAVFFEGVFIIAYLVGTRMRPFHRGLGRKPALVAVAAVVAVLAGLPTLVACLKLVKLIPMGHLRTLGFNYEFSATEFFTGLIRVRTRSSGWHGCTDLGPVPAALAALAMVTAPASALLVSANRFRRQTLRTKALLRGRDIDFAWSVTAIVTSLACTGTVIRLARPGYDTSFLGLRNWGFLFPVAFLCFTQLFASGYRRLCRFRGADWLVLLVVTAGVALEVMDYLFHGQETIAAPPLVLLIGLVATITRPFCGEARRSLALSPVLAALVAVHIGISAQHQTYWISPSWISRAPVFHGADGGVAFRRDLVFRTTPHIPFECQGPTLYRIPSTLMEQGPKYDDPRMSITSSGEALGNPRNEPPRIPVTHQFQMPRYHSLLDGAFTLRKDVLLGVLGVSLPTFRLVGSAINVGGPGEAMKALSALSNVAALASTAVIEAEGRTLPARSEVRDKPFGQWSVIDGRSDRLAVRVELPDDGLAVYSDNTDPDWHATVDGRPVETFPADVYGKAVFVPKGTHEVVFEYRPRVYEVAFFLRLAWFVFAPVVLLATWRGWGCVRRRTRSKLTTCGSPAGDRSSV